MHTKLNRAPKTKYKTKTHRQAGIVHMAEKKMLNYYLLQATFVQ